MTNVSHRFTAVVLLGVLSTSAVGCSGDSCTQLCDDARSCDMGESLGFDPAKDCATQCEDLRSESERLSCDAQFDDFMDCMVDFDICRDPEEPPTADEIEQGKECIAKTQVYLDCIRDALTM